MSKKKNAKSNVPAINVTLPDNITKEEIQHILANAIVEADDIKQEKADKLKDESISKHKGFRYLLKLLFVPEKVVEGDYITTSLLKIPLTLVFKLIELFLYLIAVGCIGYIPVRIVPENSSVLLVLKVFACVVTGVVAFLYARFFRIASIEVDKTEDRNYIFGVFTSITALISIFIAIITYILG